MKSFQRQTQKFKLSINYNKAWKRVKFVEWTDSELERAEFYRDIPIKIYMK